MFAEQLYLVGVLGKSAILENAKKISQNMPDNFGAPKTKKRTEPFTKSTFTTIQIASGGWQKYGVPKILKKSGKIAENKGKEVSDQYHDTTFRNY